MAYQQFVPLPNLNFQINRVLTNGPEGCLEEELWEIAPRLVEFNPSLWHEQWHMLALRAESQDRPLHAAYYHRMSEFFLEDGHPRKDEAYEAFSRCFNQALEGREIRRLEVPYGDAMLPAMRLGAEDEKGVVLVHGGFDSFMEEFYLALRHLPQIGYTVIIFEGPGQGRPLRQGLKMDHRWERPVSAVLDHLGLENVALVGISLGGYLALRAGAFEPRISGVVAFDVVWDALAAFAEKFHPDLYGMVTQGREKEVNDLIRGMRQGNDMVDWMVGHGMYITGGGTPFEYLSRFSRFTTREISERITGDVLVLAGEKDHFVPAEFYELQLAALKNARSVTGRMFRAGEGGDQHCQVGHLDLAWKEIVDWLKQRNPKWPSQNRY